MKYMLWLIGGITILLMIVLMIAKDGKPALGESRVFKKYHNAGRKRQRNILYCMTFGEKVWRVAYSTIFLLGIGFLFYRSIILALVLMPLALLSPGIGEGKYIKARKRQLNQQFKDMLQCVSTSLAVGKSIETAFKEAPMELRLLYPDEKTTIIKEIQLINQRLEMNITVEEAVYDLAKRTELEDILYFSEVFVICKRTGGNLVEVIKNTSRIIAEKQDFLQELELMLAQRRFEQRLLSFIPVGLIFLLSTTAPDYMTPVFTTSTGRAIMTIAILLFSIAFYISNKITEIEV